MTDAERKLWWHLRRIPIASTHFRRQATIGAYFADFASHEKRLVIEVDGGQHSQLDRIARHSRQRVKTAAATGFAVQLIEGAVSAAA